MSHAGTIIGIPGLEIERVKRREGIEVWAKPCWRPSCKHCSGTHATPLNPTTRRRPIHHEPHDLASGASSSSGGEGKFYADYAWANGLQKLIVRRSKS
jgi:hypothetical protein